MAEWCTQNCFWQLTLTIWCKFTWAIYYRIAKCWNKCKKHATIITTLCVSTPLEAHQCRPQKDQGKRPNKAKAEGTKGLINSAACKQQWIYRLQTKLGAQIFWGTKRPTNYQSEQGAFRGMKHDAKQDCITFNLKALKGLIRLYKAKLPGKLLYGLIKSL